MENVAVTDVKGGVRQATQRLVYGMIHFVEKEDGVHKKEMERKIHGFTPPQEQDLHGHGFTPPRIGLHRRLELECKGGTHQQKFFNGCFFLGDGVHQKYREMDSSG
ncbi:unnamed protein product [Amoebophrya sp. A120]|nr:unnamed protein product [Amoebophrya sp. A120]|eukprot:GSA120T00025501001.1